MSKKLSQAEIDALIAGMLSGEVDQATLDAALAGGNAEEEAAPIVAELGAAGPEPAGAAVADGSQELVDLGPISQAEVDAALREAGKGALVSTNLHTPTPGIPAPTQATAYADAYVFEVPAPPQTAPAPAPAPVPAPAPAAQARAAFATAAAAGILLDLELVLTAELVRTRMRLNQLLGLQPGSIIELDRRANEPVDVIINGHQMMKAKVVTLGEFYGIQVTESRLQHSA